MNNIELYLKQHQDKSLLRFLTCGSVDDGKSTLIGRLLYDSKMLFEDHIAQAKQETIKYGTVQNEELDFALLVDGLQSEREQGITIDVAYRFFTTEKRKYIIADTPGHEQYTRSMVTGASTADVAIILIDARKGILTQTRRHSFIVNLLGIKHVIVAINKMDLVDYSQDKFNEIKKDYDILADEKQVEKYIQDKQYAEAYNLIDKNPLLKDSVFYSKLEKIWENTLVKAQTLLEKGQKKIKNKKRIKTKRIKKRKKEIKKLKIKGQYYWYMFHTVRSGKKYLKKCSY